MFFMVFYVINLCPCNLNIIVASLTFNSVSCHILYSMLHIFIPRQQPIHCRDRPEESEE